jgi:hypothetical protein
MNSRSAKTSRHPDIRAAEGHAEIDHQPLAIAAIEIDVHADLARPAERTEDQLFTWFHFVVSFGRGPLGEQRQSIERQIGVDSVEDIGRLIEQHRKGRRWR